MKNILLLIKEFPPPKVINTIMNLFEGIPSRPKTLQFYLTEIKSTLMSAGVRIQQKIILSEDFFQFVCQKIATRNGEYVPPDMTDQVKIIYNI